LNKRRIIFTGTVLKRNIMRIYIISSGNYGSRIVNNLAEQGLASSMVGLEEIPENLPEFIDEFRDYIPDNIPEADLILAVGLFGDINMIVPIIALKSGAKSVIIPIHNPSQIPPGLQREIEESAPEVRMVFPKPFCSLRPVGDEFIDQFVLKFGKPELVIRSEELIKKVEVVRSSPCGSTMYIAQELEGIPVEEADFESGNKLHNYPCLASMATDPAVGDTIMHMAAYQIKEALNRSLGFAVKSAVVDHETCEGDQCLHQCIKQCPQVRIGVETITLDHNHQAVIEPASCGCCEICIPECPYGSITIEEHRFELD
jgi:NAD-dependent dihydropyrimidine dehydrogenase PreA subunit